MRKLLLLLKFACAIVLVLVLLLVGATVMLNSDSFQNKMLKRATALLSERLGTKVTADSIHLNVFAQQVELYGFGVEDQQQRQMLQVERLAVKANLMALRRNEVKIQKLMLRGCRALIVKADSDSVANYQFVIDSLKRKETDVKADFKDDDKPKQKLTLDINNVTIENLGLQYNDSRCQLERLTYRQKMGGDRLAEIHNLQSQWTAVTKKGPVDKTASFYALTYQEEDGQRLVTIDSLRYTTDNHKPRKNKIKPKRGAFDVGHLNICANVQATLDYLTADSLVATVKANASDVATGIDLRKISLKVATNKQVAHLKNVVVKQGTTTLKFAECEVLLPNKKEGRKLSYSTSAIDGHVVLKDISKPFAPVLSRFTQPLQLWVHLKGDDSTMMFRSVQVNTPDNNLKIKASGTAFNLKLARDLVIRFNVSEMSARGGSKEKIISQFPVKKMMMKQLHSLGSITYSGRFAILWRKEMFSGVLGTQVGKVNFQFTIDESNKYIFGTAMSDNIRVDKTFDLPDIGVASCKADFKVDISKPRTAKMRKLKGGKLPVGNVDIFVAEVDYKKIKVRNVAVDVKSDGALAEGKLKTHGRHIDISCNFSFTSTDEMKKMKITKPGIKLHRLSDEDRQKKAEAKVLKKQEKDLKKQEKALKKQEKALRKQEKALRKQEEKALRKKEKALKKQAKKEGF